MNSNNLLRPAKGERPGGRQKGVTNKLNASAKECIAKAAEGLGGYRRIIGWAKEAPENERVFWGSIFPKLVPYQVGGEPGNPIRHAVELTFKSGV